MDLQGLRKAVHQARELHPRVVEPTHELAQLLLGRDDEPHLSAAHATKAVYDRREIEHLLYVARDELADLVDDEDERLAGLPSAHQLLATLGKKAGRDVGAVPDRVAPAIRG